MFAVLMILAGGHIWAVTSKGAFAGEVRKRICVMWSASSCDQASALRQAALALFIAGLALSVVVGVAVAVHDWPALERTAAADRKLQRGPYLPYSQALLGWFLIQCLGLGITTMAIWQISHVADQVWQEGFYFAFIRNCEVIILFLLCCNSTDHRPICPCLYPGAQDTSHKKQSFSNEPQEYEMTDSPYSNLVRHASHGLSGKLAWGGAVRRGL